MYCVKCRRGAWRGGQVARQAAEEAYLQELRDYEEEEREEEERLRMAWEEESQVARERRAERDEVRAVLPSPAACGVLTAVWARTLRSATGSSWSRSPWRPRSGGRGARRRSARWTRRREQRARATNSKLGHLPALLRLRAVA